MRQDQTHPLTFWLTVWIQPRRAWDHLNRNVPRYLIPILAMLGGIHNSLNSALRQNMGEMYSIDEIFLNSISAGTLSGLLSLYLGTILFWWIGKLIGGNGTIKEIRVVFGLANLPVICGMFKWLIGYLLFGKELFQGLGSTIDSYGLIMPLLTFLEFALILWSIYIFIVCLAEALRLSILRSFLCTLITGALMTTFWMSAVAIFS